LGNMSWREKARCRGVAPEIFYPPEDDDALEAKSVCAACPVREACLEHALTRREKIGVWGGMTERERRRLLRQRRKAS
jgi:WhiB family redox-sensing transcriptional regulator